MFLDIMLPVLSGVEVARRVRAGWPDLPIVACSAAFNATLEADLRRLGVWRFLAKPFHAEVLHAVVLAGRPGEVAFSTGRRRCLDRSASSCSKTARTTPA